MLQVLEALGVATKRRTDEGVLEDTALTEESIFRASLLSKEILYNLLEGGGCVYICDVEVEVEVEVEIEVEVEVEVEGYYKRKEAQLFAHAGFCLLHVKGRRASFCASARAQPSQAQSSHTKQIPLPLQHPISTSNIDDNHSTTIHHSPKSAKMPNTYAPLSFSLQDPQYGLRSLGLPLFFRAERLFGRPARSYLSLVSEEFCLGN